MAKNKKWIQAASASIKKRGTAGVCTGDKFGGPTCPPGSKRYNLAKVFKGMASKKKKAATGAMIHATKGKLIGMRSEAGKRADEKLVAAKKLERLQDMAKSGSLTYHQKVSEGRKELSKRRLHQTGGRVGRQLGGRANLLEEVGRLDAERMNPNRRAEKSRVIGELNRGYTHGGLIKGFPKLAKKGWS